MKFEMSDGRAWYKQVVSGVFKTLIILCVCGLLSFMCLSAFVFYVAIQTTGVALFFIYLGKLCLVGLATLLVVTGLLWTWCWSNDQL